MEVRYADHRLRDLCQSDRALRAKYGHECARKIRQRIRALEAFTTLDDVMQGPGLCHPLKGPYYKDCFTLRLHGGMRLVFRLMTTEERDAHSILDGVAALVVEIINYHDG